MLVCTYSSNSMSKSFGQSFRIDKSHSSLAMKAFCSWDFKVIKKCSVKLMSENICTQLKVHKPAHMHILPLFVCLSVT